MGSALRRPSCLHSHRGSEMSFAPGEERSGQAGRVAHWGLASPPCCVTLGESQGLSGQWFLHLPMRMGTFALLLLQGRRVFLGFKGAGGGGGRGEQQMKAQRASLASSFPFPVSPELPSELRRHPQSSSSFPGREALWGWGLSAGDRVYEGDSHSSVFLRLP